MLSTWKQPLPTCAKSPHSKRKRRTAKGASKPAHCGRSSPCSKYKWVTPAWPKWSPAKTTSSPPMPWTTNWHSPTAGPMSKSPLPTLLPHEARHSSKIHSLIDGSKLENGILKEVGYNESDASAWRSTTSLPRTPTRPGTQQRTTPAPAKTSWHPSKSPQTSGLPKPARHTASKIESESENTMNPLPASQVLKKSKAKSTALALAAKTNEPPGTLHTPPWLLDTTAQPTFDLFV